MIKDNLGPDIKRLSPLTDEQLKGLIAYADSHTMFPGNFPHMGINGRDNVSVYLQHSMYKQPIRDRKALREFMPSLHEKAILEYFLEYPAKRGHLDLQTYWIGKRPAMRIAAWCLSEEATFYNCRNITNPAFSMDETIPVGDVVADADRIELVTLENAEYWANRDDIIRQNAPTEHVFKQGEGFVFNLNNAHAVLKQSTTQRWFCLGLMMAPDSVHAPKSWI
jgi:hypothetical protein